MYSNLHSIKWIWKCCLHTESHFVTASMCRCWWVCETVISSEFSTLRPEQNGQHFADNIKLNEKFCILIEISLKFVTNGPKPSLPLVMAWCRTSDKPFPEPMLTNIDVAIWCHYRPQWVKPSSLSSNNLVSTMLGGRFKNAFELLNLRALKISKLHKNPIF